VPNPVAAHHRDARHHRVATVLGDQQQHLGGKRHCGACCSSLGSAVMYAAASRRLSKGFPQFGIKIGSANLFDQSGRAFRLAVRWSMLIVWRSKAPWDIAP
jgi:hypothetical protein